MKQIQPLRVWKKIQLPLLGPQKIPIPQIFPTPTPTASIKRLLL